MAPSMAHATDARTGTSTESQSNIIPLNNHLKMTGAMVPSVSCDEKHVIAIYMSKLICPQMLHKPHMPIMSCTHVRPLHQYLCLL